MCQRQSHTPLPVANSEQPQPAWLPPSGSPSVRLGPASSWGLAARLLRRMKALMVLHGSFTTTHGIAGCQPCADIGVSVCAMPRLRPTSGGAARYPLRPLFTCCPPSLARVFSRLQPRPPPPSAAAPCLRAPSATELRYVRVPSAPAPVSTTRTRHSPRLPASSCLPARLLCLPVSPPTPRCQSLPAPGFSPPYLSSPVLESGYWGLIQFKRD